VRLAFVTGALAGGVAAVALVAFAIWIVTIVSGSDAAWAAAPWLMIGFAALIAVGTYLAERITYRRTMARMRGKGEPWAYRED
jgi:hypothetical protein